MDDIFALLKMFPFNPVAALMLAAGFAVGTVVKAPGDQKRKVLVAVALAWGIYAIWELYIRNWRSPTGDHAIRVDLVLLVPLMFSIALVGVRALAQDLKRPK